MTVSAWQVYLVTRCTPVKVLVVVSLVAFASMAIVHWIIAGDAMEHGRTEETQRFKKLGFRYAFIALFLGILSAIVPTTEEALMMTSIPPLVNNKFVQQDIPAGLQGLWYKYIGLEEVKRETELREDTGDVGGLRP